MRRIAFATSEQWIQLSASDRLAAEALRARGAEVTPLVWSAPGSSTLAEQFDAVVIRSCWDYHLRHEQFIAWLRSLSVAVFNPVDLMIWNSRKTYLMELEQRGIRIVPTLFPSDALLDESLFDLLGTDRVVVKPIVSASAHETHLLRRGESRNVRDARETMVQPFISEIEEGEWSVIFFDDRHSHTVLKRPAKGDFRVQKDFGGNALLHDAPHGVMELARQVVQALDPLPLYTRVDIVDTRDRGALLVEVELVEPELFFDLAPFATTTFSDALLHRLTR
jgi:glutathione synthase/RimK-type ligase-like ATP-grasp enzyme